MEQLVQAVVVCIAHVLTYTIMQFCIRNTLHMHKRQGDGVAGICFFDAS